MKYIYLFPIEPAMGDIHNCRKYGCEYLGKNFYSGEKNYVVKGELKDLKEYANALNYDLHPDYIYRENEFAGDIEDSCKDSKLTHVYQAYEDLKDEEKYWKRRFSGVQIKVEENNDPYDDTKVTFTGDKDKLLNIAKKLGYDKEDMKDIIKDSCKDSKEYEYIDADKVNEAELKSLCRANHVELTKLSGEYRLYGEYDDIEYVLDSLGIELDDSCKDAKIYYVLKVNNRLLANDDTLLPEWSEFVQCFPTPEKAEQYAKNLGLVNYKVSKYDYYNRKIIDETPYQEQYQALRKDLKKLDSLHKVIKVYKKHKDSKKVKDESLKYFKDYYNKLKGLNSHSSESDLYKALTEGQQVYSKLESSLDFYKKQIIELNKKYKGSTEILPKEVSKIYSEYHNIHSYGSIISAEFYYFYRYLYNWDTGKYEGRFSKSKVEKFKQDALNLYKKFESLLYKYIGDSKVKDEIKVGSKVKVKVAHKQPIGVVKKIRGDVAEVEYTASSGIIRNDTYYLFDLELKDSCKDDDWDFMRKIREIEPQAVLNALKTVNKRLYNELKYDYKIASLRALTGPEKEKLLLYIVKNDFQEDSCKDSYYSEKEKSDKEFVKNAISEMTRYVRNWEYLSSSEKRNIGCSLGELKKRIQELEAVKDSKCKDELVNVPDNIKKEFEKVLTSNGLFKIVSQHPNYFGDTHYQILSTKRYAESDFDKVVKQITSLIKKFEEKYHAPGARHSDIPVTWNFGYQEDGYISAGVDLDKMWVKDTNDSVKDSLLPSEFDEEAIYQCKNNEVISVIIKNGKYLFSFQKGGSSVLLDKENAEKLLKSYEAVRIN